MTSINSGFGSVPIASSLAGVSSSGKQSSIEKTASADGSASKVVEAAHAETGGLTGSEKSSDRDADGRQLYDQPGGTPSGLDGGKTPKQPPPRSKDPNKSRGNRLDLDA
jgi:hypothetical protein